MSNYVVTSWYRYAMKLIGSDTPKAASRRAGFHASAFTRWKQGESPDHGCALSLVRAYGGNVLEALVASGLLTAEESELREVEVGRQELLESLSSLELAETLCVNLRSERGL